LSDQFGGTSPFKVHVNFDIPIFEGQIDEDALEKWLNILEGYFSVHNFSDRENITFALLKALPHVETLVGNLLGENFHKGIWNIWGRATWDFCVDAVKEKYYPIDNYEDQYMIWTTLQQEKSQIELELKNTFHTLRTKLGIKDSEQHLALKYRGDLRRYIQTEMDFLIISSFGATYRYAFKIEHKFKHQNKWEFGSRNMQQPKQGKENPNQQTP
jgi:hypothetical protein